MKNRVGRQKKNLFFPASIEEEDRLEEEEQELPDGYCTYNNDWYDFPGGQFFVYFPKKQNKEMY